MRTMFRYSFKLVVLVAILTASLPVMASPPDAVHISDANVKVYVERELARRGFAREAIDVAVDDRVVTLSGTVANLSQKEKAAKTAGKAYGVSRVENNLTVGSVSTTAIADAVRKSIVTHPNYDTFDWIEAHVQDGVVTLSGSVREPWRKREFESRIMDVAGVSKIENQIAVLPLSSFDDDIRIQVLNAIYRNSALYRYALQANPPIHIIVEHGRVVLKGMVANKMDRQLAESLARTSSLSHGVTNELQVEGED